MRHLSQISLTRDGQLAVLQGMIHVGPDALYAEFQRDVNRAAKAGFLVFFEGTRRVDNDPPRSYNEKEIQDCFVALVDMYPLLAHALGVTWQKKDIIYPADAINADITFGEMTRELDRRGFRCTTLLHLLNHTTEDMREELKRRFAEMSFRDFIEESEKWSIDAVLGKLFAWWHLRRAMPVILDYRNEAAVTCIEREARGRDVFVHYGEAHIKGMTKLFMERGWRVHRRSVIDLLSYC